MCKAVSNDPLNLKYYLDRYKTRKMCDKAVDDFLPALEFVSNWFVMSKIKNSIMLSSQMMIYSLILVMSHFLILIWVLLV